MDESRESARELESLRDQLSRMSEANLRLSESLDIRQVPVKCPGLRADFDDSPIR